MNHYRTFLSLALWTTLLVSSLPAQPSNQPCRVLDLDGNGSYVELPVNIFTNLSEATIEGWVKWDSTGMWPRFWNFGDNRRSLDLGLVASGTDLAFGFHRGPDDMGGFQVLNLTKLGEWYHLAAVTGKGGMKLYLNGVLVGEQNRAGSFDTIQGSKGRFCIGQNTWDASEDRHKDAKCQIAEFRVWSVARTAEQIRANLNQTLTGSEPGLFGLWNFANVEDGVVKDSGPQGFHGKLMGNARTATAQLPVVPEFTRPAKVLDLDGNGSYVELPPNIFSNLNEATIEGWVKWDSTGYYPRFWNFGGTSASQEVGLAEGGTDLLFGFSRPNDMGGFRVLNLTKLGEWYHLAAVSGKGGMKLYLNGVLVGQGNRVGSFDTIPGNAPNWIGRNTWADSGGVPNKEAKSQMAEFRVWSVARTAEQIRANFNQPLTGSEPGLFGLWNFANVENGIVKDSGPHGFHGKLMGNARTVAAQLPIVHDLASPTNGSDSGRTRVQVSQLHSFRGKVTDEAGKPLPGVRIRFEQEGREILSTGTDRTTGEYSWVATFSGPICDIEAKDETGEFGGCLPTPQPA